MRYRDVFDELTDFALPSRKHSPGHWLTTLYFRGLTLGYRLHRIIKQTPLMVLWRGTKEGRSDG